MTAAQTIIRRIGHIGLIGLILYFALYARVSVASAAPPPATSSAQVSAHIPSLAVARDTTAPTPPILLRPPDGTYTSQKSIEFVWRQSTDVDSNTILYTLYLNGVPTYLGISNDGNSAGAGYTARLESGEVRLIPSPPLPDGTYDWFVTAEDLSGNQSSSTTWRLNIDTVPPTLTVTDIDTYHHLHLSSTDPASVPAGTTFTVDGPKDIYFTVTTEPYATVYLQFRPYQSYSDYQTYPFLTGVSGTAHAYAHFDPGEYEILLSAVDRAGQPAALPTFLVSVATPSGGTTIGPIGPIGPIRLIYPSPIVSLVATRVGVANTMWLLLAILAIILLIIIWYRRYNLILVDEHGEPAARATICHSRPDRTNRTYTSNRSNKIFVPHLGRLSTLTIQTPRITLTLSLSSARRAYTVVIPD